MTDGGILTEDGGNTINTLKFSLTKVLTLVFLVDTNSNNNTTTNIKNLIDSHSKFSAVVSNNEVTIISNYRFFW